MAFCFRVPDDVVEASKEYAFQHNLGNRGDCSDGNKEQQLIGIIGQNSINFLMGKPMMAENFGFDGGIDCNIFGLNFDVKTMGRMVEPKIDFVNNLIESQTSFSPDAYLFLSLNKSNYILTICGWLPKRELQEKAILHKRGATRIRADGASFQMKADTYEIPNRNIRHKIKSWQELMQDIFCYLNEAISA